MEAAVMSMYEAKTAKKVYLYRNGVENADPKPLVVNDRQVRDFSSFLTRVTSGLKAPVAVRNIYTPSGGHRVHSLEDLQTGHYYVAGGNEHFRRIKYGSPPKLLPRRPPRPEMVIPPRAHQAVVASARYKRPIEKPFVIHVFRNGDERFRGARVLLPRRIMASWEHVLELVTEKAELYTPAKRLCTLDGRMMHAVSELQDGGKYVAMEGTKPFKKVAYCATDTTQTSPLHKKSLRLHMIPRLVRPRHVRPQPHSQLKDGTLGDSKTTQEIEPHPPIDHLKPMLQRRKSRPMAGRKNKEAREKAVQDHRADSIFGGSPTRLDDIHDDYMPSPPPGHPRGGRAGRGRARRGRSKPQQQRKEEEEGGAVGTLEPVETSQEKPLTQSPEKKQSPPIITQEKKKEETKEGEREGEEEEGSPVEEELASSKGSVASRASSKATTVSTAASVASKASKESKASSKQSLTASKGQGVFYAPSKPAELSEQKPNVEHIEDSQGGESVFKANVQRSETQDAELVQESKETEIEKPVDHEEAQEVEEEEEVKEEEGKKSGTHVEQSAEQTFVLNSALYLAHTVDALETPSQGVAVELESHPLQTSVDLSLNRVQPAERSNGHTHNGSDGARDSLTEETGDSVATEAVPGGQGEGRQEEKEEGARKKEEEARKEEEKGTREVEVEEEVEASEPPLELQSEGKPLEEGPDQLVEGENGRTSKVDQVETISDKPIKSESPPLQPRDGEAEAAEGSPDGRRPTVKSQGDHQSDTGHVITSRSGSKVSGTSQDIAFVIDDPSEQI